MWLVRDWTWAMAHRLTGGYQGPCSNLHGHTYKCQMSIAGTKYNPHGMLMDFKDIKEHFQGWIDLYLDHAVIVDLQDSALLAFLTQEHSKYYVLGACNTTAENIAKHLFKIFDCELAAHFPGLKLGPLAVYETEHNRAVCFDSDVGTAPPGFGV